MRTTRKTVVTLGERGIAAAGVLSVVVTHDAIVKRSMIGYTSAMKWVNKIIQFIVAAAVTWCMVAVSLRIMCVDHFGGPLVEASVMVLVSGLVALLYCRDRSRQGR